MVELGCRGTIARNKAPTEVTQALTAHAICPPMQNVPRCGPSLRDHPLFQQNEKVEKNSKV